MSVELNNESGVEVDQPRVLALATYALDYMNIHPDADLAISFTDEATMEKLHIEELRGYPWFWLYENPP